MTHKLIPILILTQKYQPVFLPYILIVFLLFYSFTGFTQSNNIKFEQLGNNSGLSDNNVISIIQDKPGFMWFGTSNGLNKYDGYQFNVYKNNPADTNSLSSNSIKSIMEDKNAVIWVGTWGGGLNKFDRTKNNFTHFRHDSRDTNSISNDFVTCLLEDKQSNLWIGSADGDLDLFDRKSNRFIHYGHPRDNVGPGNAYVTSIFEDSQQNIWIGTIKNGLQLLDKSNRTFKNFHHNDKDTSSLCDNDVNFIFEDSRTNVWIGTNNGGLELVNKKTGTFRHFKNSILRGNVFLNYDVLSITEDNNGKFWIGTRDGGLNIFNPITGISQNYHHDDLDITSLTRNTVAGICKDLKGDIWMSTLAGGINFVHHSGNEFIHYKHNSSINSISDNNVTCIYEDSAENLWIGTDGGGLNFFDRKQGRFMHYKHEANNKNSICGDNVLSIYEDSKGNLWIGTWGKGITVFDRKKNTFKHFKNDPAKPSTLGSNNAWTIFEDREKNIWIGTYGDGLDLYNPYNDSFTHYRHEEKNSSGLNNNYVITIFEDSKGFLWIGTDGGGLNKFDKKTGIFTHFIHHDSSNSLSYDFVSNIFEDKDHNLYITTGTGLNYFNTVTHHFTVYTANDNFINEAAFGILQDDNGNLWISRAKGISCFNPVTKNFINFDSEDGLNSNMYNSEAYFKGRSGLMYFGGVNGFDEFFPAAIRKVSFDPPLVITKFQVSNKDVAMATRENDSMLKEDITGIKKITLPFSSSSISFEFASLHYGVQDRKKYKYMLEGFDKTWHESGTRRVATYTNLDPGDYVFKVKGLSNESEWSSRTISISFTIMPPFWLTWWFRSAVLVVIIGGAVGFYKFRINIIKAQKKKLEQRVLEQTEQLIKSTYEEQTAREEAEKANKDLEIKNKEMEQFAFIASHDLQEPLRTTSSFVALLQKQYQGKLDEKADKYIAFILEASERMKVLIKNLLDFSRIGNKKELERVDCDKILGNVLADLAIAISEAGADIKHDPLPVIDGYAIELKQLFQNLIINAIKFRKKDVLPEINIYVEKSQGYWQFAFKDNGIGIEEKYNEKIFAIFQRLHTRTEYEGSGIGLSYCKKIVELHNGKIWVESIPGVGSTFYFTIHSPKGKAHVAKIKSLNAHPKPY